MSFVEELIASNKVLTMDDYKQIITDRMVPWHNQNVTLLWYGTCQQDFISITPDEAEILFAAGRLKNVARGENGKLFQTLIKYGSKSLPGAIICGVLAPTTRANLRQEVVDYAKKMGYISDSMTPVRMMSGTKSLILNPDGTYSISFKWYHSIVKKLTWNLLKKFTRNFFNKWKIVVKRNELLMLNLPEHEVFSEFNIDIFRKYDIQLFYLNPSIDKILLLRAVMQRAFITQPCNMLREGMFTKPGNIYIPQYDHKRLKFNEFGNIKMNCGKLHYNSLSDTITYRLNVPYEEAIRETMVDLEKILREKYQNNYAVIFDPFDKSFMIGCNGQGPNSDVEREFITLDYTITLLRDEVKFIAWQFYDSIISLLEADSSGKLRCEYFSYLATLKHVLPEKTSCMY